MRRTLALMLVLAAVLLTTANAFPEAAKKGSKMDGTYSLTKGEFEGKIIPEDVLKKAKLVIDGDRHTVMVGPELIVGTHVLDPKKKPKTIDSKDTEGPFKGTTVLGIYKFEGDMFTVCFAPPGKDRPTEFTTKSGTGLLLHYWVRAKK